MGKITKTQNITPVILAAGFGSRLDRMGLTLNVY